MNFFAGLIAGFIVFTDTGKNICNKAVDKMIDSFSKSNSSEENKDKDDCDLLLK